MSKAKNESSAINDLIQLVATQGPVVHDHDDLMFRAPQRPRSSRMSSTLPPMRDTSEIAPLPPHRAPHGTSELTITPSPVRIETAPSTRAETIPALPGVAPFDPEPEVEAFTPAARMSDGVPELRNAETWVGTSRVRTWSLVRTFALPMGAMIAIGAAIGGYIVHDRRAARDATASARARAQAEAQATEPPTTPPTTPVMAVAATADPAPVTPAKPSLVEVRLDSSPAGATVTLVDRGRPRFLGTTPIATMVDRSRSYEVVFEVADRPVVRERLEPTRAPRLAVTFDPPVRARHAVAGPPRSAEAAPRNAAPVRTIASSEAAATAPAAPATGVLLISSKPPCEIFVDGKSTGKMTPQRALRLAAGTRTITLVSADKQYKKTFTVAITPDRPMKSIHDLMAR